MSSDAAAPSRRPFSEVDRRLVDLRDYDALWQVLDRYDCLLAPSALGEERWEEQQEMIWVL